jgi:hypothetical protein
MIVAAIRRHLHVCGRERSRGALGVRQERKEEAGMNIKS